MDQRQAAQQAEQAEVLRQRRALLGAAPERTQEFLTIKARSSTAAVPPPATSCLLLLAGCPASHVAQCTVNVQPPAPRTVSN